MAFIMRDIRTDPLAGLHTIQSSQQRFATYYCKQRCWSAIYYWSRDPGWPPGGNSWRHETAMNGPRFISNNLLSSLSALRGGSACSSIGCVLGGPSRNGSISDCEAIDVRTSWHRHTTLRGLVLYEDYSIHWTPLPFYHQPLLYPHSLAS